ncbi:MAG: DUF86 domain-containing protein [Cyanobacteria bacterium Co-bin8]|nr:DUF86 domain-containing protein [Cyanobacteria bacterium Co-bin8]
MTHLDREIILRKLQVMLRNLGLLQRHSSASEQEFLGNVEQQLIVERLLHLIIEAAIDINNHLLVSNSQPPSDTYFNSFIQVGRLGLLPAELAQRLAPSAGLRNRLVHEYDDLNLVLVYQAIKFALAQYPQYVEAIQAHLPQK